MPLFPLSDVSFVTRKAVKQEFQSECEYKTPQVFGTPAPQLQPGYSRSHSTNRFCALHSNTMGHLYRHKEFKPSEILWNCVITDEDLVKPVS